MIINDEVKRKKKFTCRNEKLNICFYLLCSHEVLISFVLCFLTEQSLERVFIVVLK